MTALVVKALGPLGKDTTLALPWGEDAPVTGLEGWSGSVVVWCLSLVAFLLKDVTLLGACSTMDAQVFRSLWVCPFGGGHCEQMVIWVQVWPSCFSFLVHYTIHSVSVSDAFSFHQTPSYGTSWSWPVTSKLWEWTFCPQELSLSQIFLLK